LNLSMLSADGLIPAGDIKDPWGNDNNYTPVGKDNVVKDYMLYCNGKDGKPWTKDDIEAKK
jgi:hypothetical protein